jgi:myo-inositol-1(or 4)-monophosphatase
MKDAALAAALTSRTKIALRAAESAAAELLRVRTRGFATEKKGASDLVTDADRAAEVAVLAELRWAFPADMILAEESDGPAGVERARGLVADQAFCWVVDPLDGTTNFAHGRLDFAVSIGLLHYGQPCLGVVLAPMRRELFCGGWHLPATRNGKRIGVPSCQTLPDALIATGFPYDKQNRVPQLLAWLGTLLPQVRCVRRNGSAALDLCDLAAGQLDAYYEAGLQPWDSAGGQAIAVAAGAVMTDLAGRPHHPFSRACVVAGPALHPALLAVLQAHTDASLLADVAAAVAD